MVLTWVGTGVPTALFGMVITPMLTACGLAQLACPRAAGKALRLSCAVAGGAAGAAAMATSQRAENLWLLPAFLVWGSAIAAAACCDAVTQRVPTPLVRQAGVVTGVLLTVGLAVQDDWSRLVISGLAAAASGLTLLLCWRFAGAGFGDVRLATLGGLGLGHATQRGLLVALIVFVLITMTQAAITLMRTGNRRSTFPYAPALAIGFLLAASV